jgi:hypothetical protein
MSWRLVLFLGTLVAVALAAVGFTLDRADAHISGPDVVAEHEWPSPFERELSFRRGDEVHVLAEGDEDLWYAAAAGVLVLTLASLPLLAERDRRRAGQDQKASPRQS